MKIFNWFKKVVPVESPSRVNEPWDGERETLRLEGLKLGDKVLVIKGDYIIKLVDDYDWDIGIDFSYAWVLLEGNTKPVKLYPEILERQ